MGLGLLAGVGALVDYWPTDIGLPRTASVLLRPSLARAHAVPQNPPALALETESAGYQDAVLAVATATASPIRLERVAADVSDDLAAPAESPTFDVVPAVATAAPAQPVSLSLPAGVEQYDSEFAEPLRQVSTGPNPADGSFFSDAVRVAGGSLANAGESIVNVGLKTGQSVAGAFRAAAGAVKKLKFF